MNYIIEFSQSVIERIESYVYLLRDPRDGQVFYIGKGVGNRVFHHVGESLEHELPSDKLDRIRSIHTAGLEVDHRIIRHGLNEDEAFEVEAALIDFVGLQGLTNLVYAEIIEPVLLITINRAFRRGMGSDELYEFTRGKWIVSKRREKAKYAFAVYKGIIRAVYEIREWRPAPTEETPVRQKWITEQSMKLREVSKGRARWEFDGIVSKELNHYINCSTEKYQTKGSQNPIKYVNC
jgi:hypothetical protein